MEAILQWGLDCIRFVQSFASPSLTECMRIITMLGAAHIYIVLLPAIYWCVDEKKGLRLSLMVLISVWVNISLKLLLDQPRPFCAAYDPSVGMISERMGGFPSGHAQNSLVIFAIIVSWVKRKKIFGIVLAIAAVLCVLIGFSRIYLGVHFPTDVLGGWIIGAALLCAYFFLADRIETLLAKGGFRAGMIAAAALSFIMILYLPEGASLMPGGTVLGLGVGYCLFRSMKGSTNDTNDTNNVSIRIYSRDSLIFILKLLVRFLLGITGMILIFKAFGKIIPQDMYAAHHTLFEFVRYALTGLWISAGAPWIFRFVRLAESATENAKQEPQ